MSHRDSRNTLNSGIFTTDYYDNFHVRTNGRDPLYDVFPKIGESYPELRLGLTKQYHINTGNWRSYGAGNWRSYGPSNWRTHGPTNWNYGGFYNGGFSTTYIHAYPTPRYYSRWYW